jgi:hypothetical protein
MHSIRLRHPWQCQPDGDSALWSRRFNWPAGLAFGEVAWLIIDEFAESAAIELIVKLNGATLSAESAGRYLVTTRLARHNQLTISHPSPPPASPRHRPFEVRLEIVDA